MPGKGFSSSIRRRLPVFLLALGLSLSFGTQHVSALTELKKVPEEVAKDAEKPADPANETEDEGNQTDSKSGIPMPDSLVKKPDDKAGDIADKPEEPAIPTEIILDLSTLPEPVKTLRVAIVEAAASGDIERLRPLMATGEDATQVSIGDAPEDPIAALKSLSGDGEGREVLAIMLDIISTSAALVDKGTAAETYVWPYFAEKSLDQLSPPEMVELYRIVTAGDVADMKEFGGYNFYRLGISKDGKWKFFVAGD